MSRFNKKLEEYRKLEEDMESMSKEELEKLIPKLRKDAAIRTSSGIIIFIGCMVALFTIRW